MNWKYFALRVFIPFISLIVARYCARSAVEAEAYIKRAVTTNKLPDSLASFGYTYLEQLYDLLGKEGLQIYQKFILYRLPSQILIVSVIYPIIRDIAQYLGRCEMRLDVFTKKTAGRFYPTSYLHSLTWPFLVADVFQTVMLLLSIQTYQTLEGLFIFFSEFAGKLAILKNYSLVLMLNGLPVAILVSIARILAIGWQTGQTFRGFRDNSRLERLNIKPKFKAN